MALILLAREYLYSISAILIVYFFPRTLGQRDRQKEREQEETLQIRKKKTNKPTEKMPKRLDSHFTKKSIQIPNKYMKTGLTSLVIRRNTNLKIQIEK